MDDIMKNLTFLFNTWMKFFFLFTPFFVMSMFMGFTRECTKQQRNRLANHSMLTVAALCVGLMFFGNIVFALFALFGITLDAWRWSWPCFAYGFTHGKCD
jgi:multiple antibiotic resistance protein